MKLLSRIVLILLAIPLVLALLFAVLLFTIDPNQFKPLIKNAAQEQDVELGLSGDLSWQLWPNLGLAMGRVSVQKDGPQSLRADVGSASVSVATLPLLKRQVQINGLYLNDVDLEIRDSGQSPEPDTKQENKPENTQAAEPGAPSIEIKSVALNNISLRYIDESTAEPSTTEFTLDSLSGENIALDGQAFPLKLSASASLPNQPPVSFSLDAQLALNLEQQRAEVSNSALVAETAGTKLQAQLASKVNWAGAFTAQGKLQVEPFEPKPLLKALDIALPEMKNPKALDKVSFSLPYDLKADSLDLPEVIIKVDNTTLRGNLLVKSLERLAIVSQWQGDAMILDDYLPPPSEDEAESKAPESEPVPLPMELLRQLDVDFGLKFNALEYKGLKMQQPSFKLKAKDGVINISEIKTQVADGELLAKSTLDARQAQAKLSFDVDSNGVQLGQILAALADVKAIEGSVKLQVQGGSQGATDQALIKNLNAQAKATSDQLQFIPVNLEKQFCQALAMLQGQKPPAHDWAQRTLLEPLSMQLNLSEETLNLKNLDATIAKLLGKAEGRFDLSSGKFNVPFALSLGSFGGEIEGCLPIPEKWRKRALPIRCKGNINDIGIGTCLPDTELLTQLAKEKLQDKADKVIDEKKQQADKAVEKKKDELEAKAAEKAKEKLGEEKAEAAEEKLKDILKRF